MALAGRTIQAPGWAVIRFAGRRRVLVHARIVAARRPPPAHCRRLGTKAARIVRLAPVTHPTLGLPPTDFRASFAAAADEIRSSRVRIAARALEFAVEADPTLTERFDEATLRGLLADAEVELERVAMSIGSGSPRFVGDWAEWVAPLYRRRRVPLDDLINLSEGIRRAVRAVLGPDEAAVADLAIDEGVRVFRWHRRLAGDARKRNRLLQLIYKGA